MSILSRGIKNSGSQILKGIFLICISFILARYMGPNFFGAFSVLTAIAIQFWTLTDLGFQRGLFFFLSSENQSKSFFLFLIFVTFLQALLGLTGFIFLNAFLIRLDNFLFFSEVFIVFLIFLNIFCQRSILNNATFFSDLKRLSWQGNAIEASSYLVHFLLILYFFLNQDFSKEVLIIFLIFQFSTNILFSFILVWNYFPEIDQSKRLPFRNHFLIFWGYCKPLFPYTVLSAIIVSLEQFILINFGNNENAAFYSVTARFALITTIISAGFLNIISREISRLKVQNDIKRINILIKSSVELIFLISSFLAVYIGLNSKEIINLLYGENYNDASITLSLYSLYIPILGTGSLVAIFYYALAKTYTYAKIQSFAQIVGIIFYFLSVYFIMDDDNPRTDIFLTIKFLLVYFVAHGYCLFLIFDKKVIWKSLFKILFVYLILLFTGYISELIFFVLDISSDNNIFNLLTIGLIFTIFSLSIFLILDKITDGLFLRKNLSILNKEDV